MDKYFKGFELYGDAFNDNEIAQWYKDEEEAYANLGSGNKDAYIYGYDKYNEIHGYNKIRRELGQNLKCMGLGSAYGYEFLPIKGHISSITVIDPSEQFKVDNIEGLPIKYVKPTVKGTMSFSSDSFDLITSFGTLHHIPNVSYLISEMARVLRPGGYMLIREPIISMGDWTKKRNGLTARERGIPFKLMKTFIETNNLEILNYSFCFSPISSRIWKITGTSVIGKAWFIILDRFLSTLFSFRLIYHRTKKIDHLGPTNVFWVLKKR